MKKLSRFSIFIFVLFFSINAITQNILVKPQNASAPIPETYTPGMYFIVHTGVAWNDFFDTTVQYNTLRSNVIQDALNWGGVTTVDGVMAVLENKKSEVLALDAKCNKLVIPIMKMPWWLSSSSDWTQVESDWYNLNSFPPANYASWNLVMDSIISKINDQWGLNPYYEIWNEPENFYWQGTPNQYYELFKNTYFAIKTNHPNAIVGGPTLASFTSIFGSSYPDGYLSNSQLDSSILGTLIDSCVAWSAPLDFISWHNFAFNGPHSFKMHIDYLDQKLSASGHGAVPYLISEWNLESNIRETPFATAYMPNFIMAMEKSGISDHSIAYLQDWQTDSLGSEFHSDFGMISWAGLNKPAWKSTLLLDALTGTKIDIDSSDVTNLAIAAAIKDDYVQILLSNYSLPGFYQALYHLYYTESLNSSDLINSGYTSTSLDSIFKGYITLSGIEPLYTELNSAIPVYQKADSCYNFGRDINLTISGANGIHSGEMFLIDSTHNNVIYYYDSLISAGYSRYSATNILYPNSIFDSESITLVDSTYAFHLQPNAVALLYFYIPGIAEISTIAASSVKFEIHPNPALGNLTVNIFNPQMECEQIQIFNSTGVLVKSLSTVNNTSIIDVSDLSNGLYYVHLKNQKYQTLKFIKQ
jgi:hypothetical protein